MGRYRAMRVLARLIVASIAALPVLVQAQPPATLPAPAAAAPVRQPVMDFDIPRQPLHQALQRYSRVTGRSLLYDSKVVRGRMSSLVRGRYGAQDALRLLIAGTGMTARYTSNDAFVLVPEPRRAGPGSAPETAGALAASARQRYYAQVQRRVLAALCADRRTRPGNYRLALRFHIDGAHAITQLEVHAAGRPELETSVRTRLTGLALGSAPPGQLGQPLTLLVQPSANPGGECDAL